LLDCTALLSTSLQPREVMVLTNSKHRLVQPFSSPRRKALMKRDLNYSFLRPYCSVNVKKRWWVLSCGDWGQLPKHYLLNL